MDKKDFEKIFWYYYLKLEHEYLEIEKTIPVDPNNSKTFSYKYMKLLESICAEMDVVFKRFCEFNEKRESGINNYEKFIKENFSEFKNFEITCYAARYDDMKLYPF